MRTRRPKISVDSAQEVCFITIKQGSEKSEIASQSCQNTFRSSKLVSKCVFHCYKRMYELKNILLTFSRISKFLKKSAKYFLVHTSFITLKTTSTHQFRAHERAKPRLSAQMKPRFWSHLGGYTSLICRTMFRPTANSKLKISFF